MRTKGQASTDKSKHETLTLSREVRVAGAGFSWPSLLDPVEGRGPGEAWRGGGDIPRGGGVEERIDEIRGEDGPPFGEIGGVCGPGDGLKALTDCP